MIWAKLHCLTKFFLVGTPMNVMTFFYKSPRLQEKESKVIFFTLLRGAQKVVAGRSLPTLGLAQK